MKKMLFKSFEFVKRHISNPMSSVLANEHECSLVLMHSFLSLLSAMLERLNPKQDDSSSIQHHGSSYIGSPTRSVTSRASSLASQHSTWDSLVSLFSSSNITASGEQPSELSAAEKGEQSSTSVTTETTNEVMTTAPSSGILPTSSSCGDVSAVSDAEFNVISQDYVLSSVFFFSLSWSLGGYVSFE